MLDISIHKTFISKEQSTKVVCSAYFNEDETTALFGKSGAGKTSVLRMIAGLEKPDSGSIIYNGVTWFDHVYSMPLKKRPVGMVFQDFNLFRHMTVLQNLAFAADGVLPDHLNHLAHELDIAQLFPRYPQQLSKGQQQKVAILRSLCVDAEVLLLDEPFSALDDDSILDLIAVTEKLKAELNLTVILVTHRKDIILKMAQSVVMMETGVQGNPNELIHLSF